MGKKKISLSALNSTSNPKSKTGPCPILRHNLFSNTVTSVPSQIPTLGSPTVDFCPERIFPTRTTYKWFDPTMAAPPQLHFLFSQPCSSATPAAAQTYCSGSNSLCSAVCSGSLTLTAPSDCATRRAGVRRRRAMTDAAAVRSQSPGAAGADDRGAAAALHPATRPRSAANCKRFCRRRLRAETPRHNAVASPLSAKKTRELSHWLISLWLHRPAEVPLGFTHATPWMTEYSHHAHEGASR